MKEVLTQAKLERFFNASIALSQQISDPEHRANPFANILNLSAKSAIQYPDLLEKKTLHWRLAHSIVGAAVSIFRSVLYTPYRIKTHPPAYRPHVLIISHLINKSHLQSNADFYFGNLSAKLELANIKTHTVLINHCRVNSRQLSSLKRSNTSVLPAFFTPLSEIKHLARLLYAANSLPKCSFVSTNTRFYRLAKIAQFGSRAMGDYRIGKMIAKSIETMKPSIVIQTFEGHGWEKIVTASAHSLPIKAHVIAYQHAILSPGNNSIYYDHGGETAPDHVFTTGEFTRRELEKNATFLKGRISVVGSVKHEKTQLSSRFKPNGECLFAPEGTFNELRLMIKVAVDCAKLYPEITFNLRLHPVIKTEQATKVISEFNPLPSNFKLSTRSLNNDLKASSWVCFRGSTVALQGIAVGLRPIYIDTDYANAQNNPIPKSVTFQRVAKYASDVGSILYEDQKHPELAEIELRQAAKFVKEYFQPMEPITIINHIKRHLK